MNQSIIAKFVSFESSFTTSRASSQLISITIYYQIINLRGCRQIEVVLVVATYVVSLSYLFSLAQNYIDIRI